MKLHNIQNRLALMQLSKFRNFKLRSSCLKLFLPALMLFVNFVLNSQPITLKIKNGQIMSNRYHRWFADTSKISFDVSNPQNSSFAGYWKFRLSNIEGTDVLWGNNLPDDTILLSAQQYKRFYFKEISTAMNALFDEYFINTYRASGKIPFGQYKFQIEIRNFNDVVESADSITIQIDSIMPPSNILPLNGLSVHKSHKNRIHFGFLSPNAGQVQGIKHIIKIWQRDSAVEDIQTVEKSTVSFMDTTTNVFHYKIGNKYTLLPNKTYYWAVESRDANWVKFGDRNGLSELFNFRITDKINDSIYGQYKDTLDLWQRESNGGPPAPPDPAYCAVFPGFETGDLQANGWSQHSGDISFQNRKDGKLYSPNVDNQRIYSRVYQQQIHDNLQILCPPGDGRFGTRCAEIGKFANDMHANSASIRKTFTVTNATKYVKVWYAVACQGVDAHNDNSEEFWKKNFFQAQLYQGSTVDVNNKIEDPIFQFADRRTNVAPGYCTSFIEGGNTLRVDWHCRTMDFSAYIGQTVTLDLLAASCKPSRNAGGTHKTLALVDFCVVEGVQVAIAGNQTDYCKTSNMTLNSGNTSYIRELQWEIWKSNPAGQLLQQYHTQYSLYCNFSPSSIDVASVIRGKGIAINCNDYFKVLLLGKNECCKWDTATRLIHITCPDQVVNGPFCCINWNCSMQIGVPQKTGYSYLWFGPGSGTGCLSSTTVAQPTFSCGSFNPNCTVITGPIVYNVRVTSNIGCVDTQSLIISSQPLQPTLTVDTLECYLRLCGRVNSFSDPSITYTLKRLGYKPLTINSRCYEYAPTKRDTWELTANNACGSLSVTQIVEKYNKMTGNIDTLRMPWSMKGVEQYDYPIMYQNRFNPNSKYNAFEYRLSLVSRLGSTIQLDYGYNPKGFANGTIKIPSSLLQKVMYYGSENILKLEMRNCDLQNNKMYFSNIPYSVIPTKPNFCEVCVGDQKIKFMRAWYKEHSGGGQSACYSLKTGGDSCTASDWLETCTSPNKNTKITNMYLQRNCVCPHKVYSWLYEVFSNPLTYRNIYNQPLLILRNNSSTANNQTFPVYFER